METQIKITLPEVSNVASKIRNINEQLFEVLSYANRTMIELSSSWQSETSKTIVERFENFSNKFLEEKEVLNKYADFLDETVANYDSIESVLNANAENF